MPLFTVLLPTHDHQDTLLYSVRSVLAQTEGDLELFIVGDGAPPKTREIAAELSAADPRVRYFDFPKGERLGERHRHRLLMEEARGTFVAYQADDDLWLPDHLETLAQLLQDADLAHTMSVEIRLDGSGAGRFADGRSPAQRARLLEERSSFGLNSAAHRLDAYRRLPEGWRPTPPDINTDHYMWCQFLAQPWCRLAAEPWPTALHLSSLRRQGHTVAQRTEELRRLTERLADPLEQARLRRGAQRALADEAFRMSADRKDLLRASVARMSAETASSGLLLALGAEIRFGRFGRGAALLLDGFSLTEPWGVWTHGEEASLVLAFAPDCPRRLCLVWTLNAFVSSPQHPRVLGSLRVGSGPPVELAFTRFEGIPCRRSASAAASPIPGGWAWAWSPCGPRPDRPMKYSGRTGGAR
jgi:GalNAc5-diNAcBac-PP-undecaprenol beta-1,3-glucosyltransferase